MTDQVEDLDGLERFYLAKGEGNCEDVVALVTDLRAAKAEIAALREQVSRLTARPDANDLETVRSIWERACRVPWQGSTGHFHTVIEELMAHDLAQARRKGAERAASWHDGQAAHHKDYAVQYPDADGERSTQKAQMHIRSAAAIRALPLDPPDDHHLDEGQ